MANCTLILCADMFLALDKDMNGTLSKQELREYADGTLTEIFIERGRKQHQFLHLKKNISYLFKRYLFVLL